MKKHIIIYTALITFAGLLYTFISYSQTEIKSVSGKIAQKKSTMQAVKKSSVLPAEMTTLITGGKSRCAIIAPEDDSLSKRTANRLAEYLKEQTGVRPSILSEANLNSDNPNTLVVLDGTPQHRLLARLGISVSVPNDRADAYHLRVLHQKKQTVIAAAGKSPSGVKFATYRLMEEMELGKGFATVPNLDLTMSPFFKTRSITLSSLWLVSPKISKQCNLESWPVKKILHNLDMYDAFGFNGIETSDRLNGDFLEAAYGITREGWRNKVYALCDGAHERDMTVFLRMWGNSVTLPVKKRVPKPGEHHGSFTPFGYENLAPDIPEERKRWDTEIRDYNAKNYASHIDNLITHWADAGGIHPGSHATIKDALLLCNELRAAFRAINPKIEITMDLWNMQNPRGRRGWPGYENVRSITRAGVLAKDVIIAQATRANSSLYSQKVTDEIIADGYRPAVWTWRRGDSEVPWLGLRIRIHGVMGDYFHGMPEGARQLEFHNIERNQHGTASDVNYYIAGKLMWDPKTDVDAVLNKYCALVFGSTNAKRVAEAFLTIEVSRDVENQISENIVSNPAEGAKRARQALAGLKSVNLAPGHLSRLPSVTSPKEMLDELRATLAVIAENAEIVAQQLPAMDALIQAGRKDSANAIAAVLRKKANTWAGTMAGGVEGFWLQKTIQAKLAPKLLGFRTSANASFEQKDAGFLLKSKDKGSATAMLELKTPARHRVEFHFKCMVADAEIGLPQTGGFAFGSQLLPTELTDCQADIDKQELSIRGLHSIVGFSESVKAQRLDPTNPLNCTVIVDLDQHRVTFKVGDDSVNAKLDPSLKAIRYYGYQVEDTQASFGPIKVTYAK